MKLLYWIRLKAKLFVIAIGFGDRLIEFCFDCGVEQPVVWWADNELWSKVTGEAKVEGDNMPGVFCPKCFDRRADEMGVFLRWTPTIHE